MNEMQASLASILQTKFPGIATISRENGPALPEAPYFYTELTLAEFEPISPTRYTARFRFHISYAPGPERPVALIIDEMLEAVSELQVGGRTCRASSVAWERLEDKAASEDGYFRAEYIIQMTTDQEETGIKMQTLKQGGGLK
ncbi:MAG: phage tail terminator family protein [Bacillota bacterium]